MRPDAEYIKGLLAAFQDSPEPTVDIRELEAVGIPYQLHEFYFHMKLLYDQGFIERDDDCPGIGFSGGAGGGGMWSVIPLRLTASGHAFAEALTSHPGWEAVKKSGITTSIGIMKDIAVTALKAELVKHGFIPH